MLGPFPGILTALSDRPYSLACDSLAIPRTVTYGCNVRLQHFAGIRPMLTTLRIMFAIATALVAINAIHDAFSALTRGIVL
jgi:hypothetical protein